MRSTPHVRIDRKPCRANLVALAHLPFADKIFDKAWMSFCESMGFDKCSSIPAFRQRTLSSVKALALMATMGMVPASSRASERMARVASYPSILGIMMSNMDQIVGTRIRLFERAYRLGAVIYARHLRTSIREYESGDLAIQIVILD